MRREDLVLLHYNYYNISIGAWESAPVGESMEPRGNQMASRVGTICTGSLRMNNS